MHINKEAQIVLFSLFKNTTKHSQQFILFFGLPLPVQPTKIFFCSVKFLGVTAVVL